MARSGEQQSEAQPARFEDIIGTTDVQVALVLAGEAGGRQVLGRGRAADRDGDMVRYSNSSVLYAAATARRSATEPAAS